ncbi:hypothetical protein ACWDV4_27165, partial [Micromonospora sp. NPDC003197]
STANRLPLTCSAGVRFLSGLKAAVSTEESDDPAAVTIADGSSRSRIPGRMIPPTGQGVIADHPDQRNAWTGIG